MTMAEATADKNTAAPPTGLRAASSLKGRLIQEQVAIIAAFTWTFQDLLGPLCAKVESAQKSSTGLAELLQARLIEPESIESHLLWNGNKSLSTGSGEDDFDDEDHEEFTRRFIVRLLKLSGRKVPSNEWDHQLLLFLRNDCLMGSTGEGQDALARNGLDVFQLPKLPQPFHQLPPKLKADMLCQLIEASLQQAPKLRESIDMEDPVQRSITNGLQTHYLAEIVEGVKQTRRYFYIPGSARLYCETIRDRGSKPSVFEQVTTNVTEIQALADRFAATDEQNGSRVVDNDNINNGGDDAEDKGEQNQADTSTKDQQGEAAAKPSRRRRSQPAQGSAVKRVARKAERELAELLRSFVIPEQISLQRRRERWSKKQMQLGRLLGTVNNNLSNQQAAAELSQSGAERRTAIIGSLDGGRSRRNRPQVQYSHFFLPSSRRIEDDGGEDEDFDDGSRQRQQQRLFRRGTRRSARLGLADSGDDDNDNNTNNYDDDDDYDGNGDSPNVEQSFIKENYRNGTAQSSADSESNDGRPLLANRRPLLISDESSTLSAAESTSSMDSGQDCFLPTAESFRPDNNGDARINDFTDHQAAAAGRFAAKRSTMMVSCDENEDGEESGGLFANKRIKVLGNENEHE